MQSGWDKINTLAAAALVTIACAGSAHANVTAVGTQASFSALGAITQNTNWDAYPSDGTWTFPGSPFSVGDLTFIAGGQNLIGGVNTYSLPRNLLTDNYVAGTTTLIAGNHDLFAFNAGNFFATGSATFDITTNLGSYQFVETVQNGAGGFDFFGYQAGAGEYFTSFKVSGYGATGFTDVQLGQAQAVPEPETYALMLGGLGFVAFVARRRRKA